MNKNEMKEIADKNPRDKKKEYLMNKSIFQFCACKTWDGCTVVNDDESHAAELMAFTTCKNIGILNK